VSSQEQGAWVIGSDDGLFWSNEDGWVDKDSATKFSTYERQMLRLPLDGKWVEA
jgi:hypothetical protein